MPTRKPMYSIVVDEDLLKKIDDYQFGNRFRSRSSATVELIKIAMQTLEGKEPTEESQKNKPMLSEQEEALLASWTKGGRKKSWTSQITK